MHLHAWHGSTVSARTQQRTGQSVRGFEMTLRTLWVVQPPLCVRQHAFRRVSPSLAVRPRVSRSIECVSSYFRLYPQQFVLSLFVVVDYIDHSLSAQQSFPPNASRFTRLILLLCRSQTELPFRFLAIISGSPMIFFQHPTREVEPIQDVIPILQRPLQQW